MTTPAKITLHTTEDRAELERALEKWDALSWQERGRLAPALMAVLVGTLKVVCDHGVSDRSAVQAQVSQFADLLEQETVAASEAEPLVKVVREGTWA